MSDHLIAEANRHAKALSKMNLPKQQPTQRDIEWYIEECIDLRKQLDQECASKREHLRIACEEINGLKVRVGMYERENAALREAAPKIKAAVSEQLQAALSGTDLSLRYSSIGDPLSASFIRWGLVEKRIYASIDAALAGKEVQK
jgi:hypothetical protein